MKDVWEESNVEVKKNKQEKNNNNNCSSNISSIYNGISRAIFK